MKKLQIRDILILFLSSVSVVCEGLKDIRVAVPSAIRKGETAVFLCDFDQEDEQIYTVKWYRGRKEFYRYTPKDEQPIKIFRMQHIEVDVSLSFSLNILLVPTWCSGWNNCSTVSRSCFESWHASNHYCWWVRKS